MSMKGLWAYTAAIQTAGAWKDWRELALEALATGFTPEQINAEFTPPDDAGWKRVDKYSAKLRKAMDERRASS